MTLAELLGALVAPDHFPGGGLLPLDVEFKTAERSGLYLMSAYYSDGKIVIDIGDDDDE